MFAICKEIRPQLFLTGPQPPWEFPGARVACAGARGIAAAAHQAFTCRCGQSCGLENTLLGKRRGKPGGLGKKSESNPAGFGGNLENRSP